MYSDQFFLNSVCTSPFQIWGERWCCQETTSLVDKFNVSSDTIWYTYKLCNIKNDNISFVCCVFSCAIQCVLLEDSTQLEGERSCSCSLLAVIYWINAQSLVVSRAALLSWEKEAEWEDSKVPIQMHIPKNGRRHTIKRLRWYIDSFQRSPVHCLELFITQQDTKHCCTQSKSEVKWKTCLWDETVSSENF